jgi:hypothetical protein
LKGLQQKIDQEMKGAEQKMDDLFKTKSKEILED